MHNFKFNYLSFFCSLISAPWVSWRMQTLGFTMCILVLFHTSAPWIQHFQWAAGWKGQDAQCAFDFFSSFSTLISSLKDDKVSMHNVRSILFIIQLIDFSILSQLKHGKARMHNVHLDFFIFHLTDISTSSQLKDEKARMQNLHSSCFIFLPLDFGTSVSWRMNQLVFTMFILALSSFSSLIAALSVWWRMNKLGCTMCILAFSFFTSLISALRELKDEKGRMYTVHLSVFHRSAHRFSAAQWKSYDAQGVS